MPKPIVGVTADSVVIRDAPGVGLYRSYVDAVASGAECVPMIVPPLGAALDFDSLLEGLHGFVFTGAISNIQPHHYGGLPSYEGCVHDAARDETTLALLPAVLERGIPFFGICRGMQELNVVLGGTLHQEIHKVPGMADHRAEQGKPLEERFAPAHDVAIEAGGEFAQLLPADSYAVNSVHGQGVDSLAHGLRAEALAPDGLVEAVSVRDAKNFAVAVQWHPEWEFDKHPLDTTLWREFGKACEGYATDNSRPV